MIEAGGVDANSDGIVDDLADIDDDGLVDSYDGADNDPTNLKME